MRKAILCMSQKEMGMVLVADDHQHLLGIFTDGDLRRVFEKYDNINHLSLSEVMTPNPKTIFSDVLVTDALSAMVSHGISTLAVLDRISGCLIGAVSLNDIQQEGLN